jgi:hypothetical protein
MTTKLHIEHQVGVLLGLLSDNCRPFLFFGPSSLLRQEETFLQEVSFHHGITDGKLPNFRTE